MKPLTDHEYEEIYFAEAGPIPVFGEYNSIVKNEAGLYFFWGSLRDDIYGPFKTYEECREALIKYEFGEKDEWRRS